MSIETKIAELSKLMVNGVLTTEEFTKIVTLLKGDGVSEEREKTPAEKTYEDYIVNHVAPKFKSPSSVKFPPFNPSMVREAVIKLDFKDWHGRFIETYVDAPNSYGTMLREQIIIAIDDSFVPQFWAQHVLISPLLGKGKGWVKMG